MESNNDLSKTEIIIVDKDLTNIDLLKNYFKNDREDDAAKLTSPTDAGTGRGRGKNNGDEVDILKELESL